MPWRPVQGQPPILTHTLDVADRASVERIFQWAAELAGPIDILVNNAGINLFPPDNERASPEDWDRLISVNATGAYNCLRAVLPQMREREDGLVINISSISGKRAGVLGGVGYNASKFAMTALATTVSIEEAKRHIRISSIFPGEVETPILEHRPVPVRRRTQGSKSTARGRGSRRADDRLPAGPSTRPGIGDQADGTRVPVEHAAGRTGRSRQPRRSASPALAESLADASPGSRPSAGRTDRAEYLGWRSCR